MKIIYKRGFGIPFGKYMVVLTGWGGSMLIRRTPKRRLTKVFNFSKELK